MCSITLDFKDTKNPVDRLSIVAVALEQVEEILATLACKPGNTDLISLSLRRTAQDNPDKVVKYDDALQPS